MNSTARFNLRVIWSSLSASEKRVATYGFGKLIVGNSDNGVNASAINCSKDGTNVVSSNLFFLTERNPRAGRDWQPAALFIQSTYMGSWW
jgi:hypothetical protein